MSRRRRLNPDQVRAIRAGTGTYLEIADRFGISESMVGQIRRRVLYRDVRAAPSTAPKPAPVVQMPRPIRKGDLVKLKSGGPTMTVADASLLGTIAVVYAVEGVVRTVTLDEVTVERVTG